MMTPASPNRASKPIDVAEQWIHFVDNSVRDSELHYSIDHRILPSALRCTDRGRSSTWNQLATEPDLQLHISSKCPRAILDWAWSLANLHSISAI